MDNPRGPSTHKISLESFLHDKKTLEYFFGTENSGFVLYVLIAHGKIS